MWEMVRKNSFLTFCLMFEGTSGVYHYEWMAMNMTGAIFCLVFLLHQVFLCCFYTGLCLCTKQRGKEVCAAERFCAWSRHGLHVMKTPSQAYVSVWEKKVTYLSLQINGLHRD